MEMSHIMKSGSRQETLNDKFDENSSLEPGKKLDEQTINATQDKNVYSESDI